MSDHVKVACEILGLLMVLGGLALVSIPAAIVAAGVALIILGNLGGHD